MACFSSAWQLPAASIDVQTLAPGIEVIRYDAVELEVRRDGATTLAFDGVDPDPLAPGDVQVSSTLNLAAMDAEEDPEILSDAVLHRRKR